MAKYDRIRLSLCLHNYYCFNSILSKKGEGNMGAKNKKTIELSQEEFDVIKRLLRVAAAETDNVSEDFPDNKKAIKEANVIQSLYTVTFAA